MSPTKRYKLRAVKFHLLGIGSPSKYCLVTIILSTVVVLFCFTLSFFSSRMSNREPAIITEKGNYKFNYF